ncbi:MAG: radical SAM protein [Candidatus Vogelbacteria bacterium]|nr:radical SAM protein [Candidatus Vogelbacteria bacterium]
MLRVGFIFPTSHYLFDPFRGDPHTHFQILTVLEDRFEQRIEPLLIDLRGIKPEFAIYHIPECDVYLHSVYTLDYNEQVEIVKQLRQSYPKAKHIAGGPHAVEFQDESLKIFDSLIIGEGEEKIKAAIQDVMDGKLKTKYVQEQRVDINAYPYPKRKYLPKSVIARKDVLSKKIRNGYEELLGTTAMFSRGCPYSCAFCAMLETRKYIPGIRYRSPQLITEEIEYLKRDYGLKCISILDEICFPPNRQQAILHLEAIARTGIIWKGQSRVDGVDEELARLAAQSGCVSMGLGVESVSQKALDIINKKVSIGRARETIRLLKKYNIQTRVYMILGLPGEPEDIVKQTWDFIQETGPDVVTLSLFTVRPGTEIFNNPKRFGLKRVDTDWSKTMHMYSRFDKEMPSLTFEYDEQTPWGKGIRNEVIVENYLSLQDKLKETGLSVL